jgi:chemotaxis protein MotB
MFGTTRNQRRSINVWPGYVDALSALLMVVIFVLLIFIIAQFLLSEILSGQESELSSLHIQVNELTEMLGLEEKKGRQLNDQVMELSFLVSSLTETRTELNSKIKVISQRSEMDRAELKQKIMLIGSLQEDIDALRRMRQELEDRVGNLAVALQTSQTDLGSLRDRSKALEARLAEETDRTFLAQKDVEMKNIRIQALTALIGRQKQAIEEQRQLSADARAEVALLSQQINFLRKQLEEISQALDLSKAEKKVQTAEIKDLGKRLNIALARRVNELERYRSEFFGRLRMILGDNPYVQIVGDRFVFQAELLFASGSADLGEEGKMHLAKLSATLRDISIQIQKDIEWILRIDGHTDRVPIFSGKYVSNWELSTTRALSVVKFLARQGIPENRMAAAGFSKFHPLDPADTPAAYRKNRRIEIKLTSR